MWSSARGVGGGRGQGIDPGHDLAHHLVAGLAQGADAARCVGRGAGWRTSKVRWPTRRCARPPGATAVTRRRTTPSLVAGALKMWANSSSSARSSSGARPAPDSTTGRVAEKASRRRCVSSCGGDMVQRAVA
nr:hypothetical protein [Ottowia beijingensis]